MRLAWLSDIHLDCVADPRQWWASIIARTDWDAAVITGDIAQGMDLERFLGLLACHDGRPVSFVLGNHDYWDSSFHEVDLLVERFQRKGEAIATAVGKSSWPQALHVLPELHLTHHAVLVGVNGWYDCRNGDAATSNFTMVDKRSISELRIAQRHGREHEMLTLQARTDADAQLLRRKIEAIIHHRGHSPFLLIVATHVPPFAGAAWHEGNASDNEHLPWFSNRSIGDAILQSTKELRANDGQVLVLCGHSHSEGTMIPKDENGECYANIVVRTAGAEYGKPKIFDIIYV